MKLTMLALLAALTFACAKDELGHSNAISSIANQGSSSGPIAASQTFTGRAIKNEEALKLADAVIVGRIVDLGRRDPGAPGQVLYGNVKVEVVQTIKGAVSKTITLFLTVQKFPEEKSEEPPKIDNKYIVFLKKLNPKDTKGIKLIEATEENVTRIIGLARATGNKN